MQTTAYEFLFIQLTFDVLSGQGYQVTSLQKTFAEGLKTRPNDLSVDWKVAAIKGKYLQDNYHDIFYAKARNLAWMLRRKIDEALTQVDVLIMPATPKKARPLPSADISLKGK